MNRTGVFAIESDPENDVLILFVHFFMDEVEHFLVAQGTGAFFMYIERCNEFPVFRMEQVKAVYVETVLDRCRHFLKLRQDFPVSLVLYVSRVGADKQLNIQVTFDSALNSVDDEMCLEKAFAAVEIDVSRRVYTPRAVIMYDQIVDAENTTVCFQNTFDDRLGQLDGRLGADKECDHLADDTDRGPCDEKAYEKPRRSVNI